MRHKGIFIASFIHSESTSPTTVPQALCTARGFCFIWVNNEPRSRHHLMQVATNTNYAQKSYHQKWVDKQQQKTHLIGQVAVLPILWMGCKRPFDSLRRVKLLWPLAQNVHQGTSTTHLKATTSLPSLVRPRPLQILRKMLHALCGSSRLLLWRRGCCPLWCLPLREGIETLGSIVTPNQ